MNDILMTNIFFGITALSSVIITIVLVILLVYLIRLVRRVDEVTRAVKDETIKVISDVDEVRGAVRQHLNLAKNVAGATFIKTVIEKILTTNKK